MSRLFLLLSLFVSLSLPSLSHQSPSNIVGYFPQWGLYGGYFAKNLVTSGSAPLLTHVNYAFGNIVNNQCQSYDSWADYQDPLAAAETVNGQADSSDPNAFAGNFHQF